MIPTHKRALIFHGTRIYYADGWQDVLTNAGISIGDDWSILNIGEQVSLSPITNCFRIVLDSDHVVYFKRYVYKKRRLQFYFPMPSKAVVENFGYHQLNKLAIPTAEVIAFGENRNFGDLRAAFIVTREIPDSVALDQFARNTWYGMKEPERSRVYKEITIKILDQVKLAHRTNFFHHDLKWRNILIKKTSEGYMPFWIDCPRAAIIRLRYRRGRLIDLGGLARLALSYLTVTQQYRMLAYYLGADADKKKRKNMYRRIQRYLSRRPPKILQLSS